MFPIKYDVLCPLGAQKSNNERDDRAFPEVPLIQQRHFLDLARDWIFAEILISIMFAVYMEKCMEGRDAKKRRLVGTWGGVNQLL